ncbi:TlpA family protein disulfide reductase [Streptomyces angustmyceticus]|uniref:TlpA family protein disulfide reductase n=1 Tax=Streptomyces angustmyceticus TaxID=285578 RepID=UPI0034502D57
MKTPTRLIVLSLAALTVVTVGAGLLVGQDGPDRRRGYHQGKDGVLTIEARRRPPAPGFTGSGLDGKPLGLAAYKGKTVLVNGWASWCGPCRAETPLLVRAHEKLRARGVVVVGLDQDNSAADGRAFAGEFHMSYPSLLDADGKQARKLPKGVLNTQGLPFTFAVDPYGKIAAAASGQLDAHKIDALVKAAQAGTAPPSHTP